MGHPCKFQPVSRLGSVTARHSSSGRQPNFAALNRGRHLCSAGRPSGWALAHILVLTSFFFLFFLAYSQRSEIGCRPYFHTWCSLSVYLECRSETCYVWLAEKHRTQKIAKKSPYGHHPTTLSGYVFVTKAYIDNRKKNSLSSRISST